MKGIKLNSLWVTIAALCFVVLTACEGPEGPAGPAGAKGDTGAAGAKGDKGDPGVAGTDGTDGVDGNMVCVACHNLGVKAVVEAQYETSVHGIGAVAVRGTRVDCAPCHSDQGFVETQYTGLDTTAAGFALPQRIQCHTCHAFHESLDFENDPNSALRTKDPVELLMYRADGLPAVTLDLGDESNLCANCHQPRHSWEGAYAADTVPGTDGAEMDQQDSRFGPHHGPQSTSLAGFGLAEIDGAADYPMPGTGSTHAEQATCLTCHMYEKNHTWNPTVDACNVDGCHAGSPLTSVDMNSGQNTINTLLGVLEGKLKTAGLLSATGSIVKGVFPTDQVAALWNYEWLVDDRSAGVHNPVYISAIINNSIAVFP